MSRGCPKVKRSFAQQLKSRRSPIDLTHATRADLREDFVRAEFVAYRERHMQDAVKFS